MTDITKEESLKIAREICDEELSLKLQVEDLTRQLAACQEVLSDPDLATEMPIKHRRYLTNRLEAYKRLITVLNLHIKYLQEQPEA